MSKKRKKKSNMGVCHDGCHDDHGAPKGDMMQRILSDMLDCGQCADAGTFTLPSETGLDEVEHLIKVLPGITYIENLLVDYLFSDGLTTGSIEQDRILNEFLFRHNRQGTSNLAVLRDAIGNASLYGESGVRWYENDIYMLKAGKYGALLDREDGIEYPVCYFSAEDLRYIHEGDVKIPDEDITPFDIEQKFEEQHLVLLDKSNFVNIRNNTKELHGESPLLSDELRVKLLEAVYSRLNYDIQYDGPGRLILRPKDGYVTGDVNEVGSSTIMTESVMSAKGRMERAKEEVKKVGKEIRDSRSDDVILLSNAFDKDITHLERVTKATQFFDWLDNEGAIIAQAIGLPPSLLEMGKVSGNVSMQRILDNAMENAIVPLREKFAIQFSPLLSEKLGIEKVYFGKYQRASAPDRETMRTKVAEIMTMLHSIETPETDKLVKDFAEMLSYDIHNSDGTLVELGIGNLPDDRIDLESRGKSDEQNNRRIRQG